MLSQFFFLLCEIIGRFLSMCFRSRLLCSSGIPLTVVQTISKCQEASFDILKLLNDTTFRWLKQKKLLGHNWTAGPVLTTPEGFENWDFALKMHQMFSVHTRPGELENSVNNHRSVWMCVCEENSVRERIWLSDAIAFEKLLFQN